MQSTMARKTWWVLSLLLVVGCGEKFGESSLRLYSKSTGGADFGGAAVLDLADQSRFEIEGVLTYAYSDPESASFESVESNDPEVVEVTETNESTFEVAGRSTGSATIDVESAEHEATMRVEVREVDRMQLEPLNQCGDTSGTHFLAGFKGSIEQKLLAANDDELFGYGYHPVETEGEVSASVDDERQASGRLFLDFGEETGPVTVRPTIDGFGVELEVVSTETIEEVEPSYMDEFSTEQTYDHDWIERTFWAPAFTTADRATVCRGLPDHEIEMETPGNCEVEFMRRDGKPTTGVTDYYERWYARETIKQAGNCRYTVQFEEISDEVQVDRTIEE